MSYDMTNERNGDRDMDDIGRLIRYAGARELVSPERLERARARVDRHWQGVVAEHRRGRWRTPAVRLAMAAAVLVAIAAGILLQRVDVDDAAGTFAAVGRVAGEVLVDGRPVGPGDRIEPGSEIRTGADSRLALLLAPGQSLRIDTQTTVAMQSGDRFAVETGGVYVDSGTGTGNAPVFVETHLGVATDVGTQFEVRVSADAVTIGVREGLVALARQDGAAVSVDTGELYAISADGHERRETVSPESDRWDWALAIAPAFDTDGATLSEYLGWYARERGFELAWRDAASRQNAEAIELRLTIDGLSLEQGFDAVRRIAPFDYDISGRTMTVAVE